MHVRPKTRDEFANSRPNTPVRSLAVTWLLLFPLLVFASQNGFSFQHGSINTAVGSASAGLVNSMSGEDSLILRLQSYAVYLICCVVLFPFVRSIASSLRRDVPLVILVCWACSSLLWTQDSRTTLVSCIYLIVNIALAYYLLERFSVNDLMKIVMLVGMVAVVASVVLIVFFPKYGLQNRSEYALGAWQGIFGQKNICGEVLSYLLLPAFFVRLDGQFSRILRSSYVVALLIVIAATGSVGSWFICIATISGVCFIQFLTKFEQRSATVIALVTLSAALCIGVLVYQSLDVLLPLVGKDPTLTGRTKIWGLLMLSVSKRPLVGYGFAAFWQGLHGESTNVAVAMNWPGISYAENGVVELVLELGLIGLFLYLALYLRAVRDGIYCFRRNNNPSVRWFLSILVFTIFSNIEAGKLFYPSNLECILQILAFIGLREQRVRIQDREAV